MEKEKDLKETKGETKGVGNSALTGVGNAAPTKEEFDAKMAIAALRKAELEVLEKELNLQDLQERLAEREMKRDVRDQDARTKGVALRQNALAKKAVQARCNHRKGGQGAQGVIGGQGDDNQYAVLKHKMSNSDIWVRCLRCGKWWIPPVRKNYQTEAGYLGAVAEYHAAVEFPTRNIMSSSIAFQWGDGGAFYREQVANTINT